MHQIRPAPSVEAATTDAICASRRQPALNARFNTFMHLEDDLDAVVCEACRVAAEGLNAGFAGVLRYRADEDAFVLQAGIGWLACMVGCTQVAADPDTAAGLAWLTGQLIHLRPLDPTGCIRIPEAMIERGTRCLASVPIHGGQREAFGVLEVGSAEVEAFTRPDLAFLRRLANSVAMAVGLHAVRASRAEQAEPAEERRAALTGRLDTAVDRQSLTGSHYRQDAQGEAG